MAKTHPIARALKFATVVSFTLSALLSAQSSHAAPQYLHCPVEDRPSALGFDFIIDKEARTLSSVFPGESNELAMPISETATEYVARFDLQDKPMLLIRINRFTLRYSVFNAFSFDGKPDISAGKCELTARKL